MQDIKKYVSPNMITKRTLNFGVVELYENFAIGEMNEGVDLKAEEQNELLNLCTNTFNNRPFGYISHRQHSYSVDPKVYINTGKVKTLVAIAVVITQPAQKLSASIEEIFFGRPFKYFHDLDEAKSWMAKTVSQQALLQ